MAIPFKLTYRQDDLCQIRRYCKNFWLCSKIYPNDLQMRSNFGIAEVVSYQNTLKASDEIKVTWKRFCIPIYIYFFHVLAEPHGMCPDQGWNPCLLHWKCGVLATGPPGKSLFPNFWCLVMPAQSQRPSSIQINIRAKAGNLGSGAAKFNGRNIYLCMCSQAHLT